MSNKELIKRLEAIVYAGMPKPNSFEDCSLYYENSILTLIEELKKNKAL